MEINRLGAVEAMQVLLPPMVDRGDGAVAVVCSVNSLVVEAEASAYAATKAARHAVRSAALEDASSGVRMFLVSREASGLSGSAVGGRRADDHL